MAEENRNDVYRDLRDTLTNQFTKIIETIKEEDLRKAELEESLKERSSYLERKIDEELSYIGVETEGLSDEEKEKKIYELREKFSDNRSIYYDRLGELAYGREDILHRQTEIENIEQNLKDTVQRDVDIIVKFQKSLKETINERTEKIVALTKENEVRGIAINSDEIEPIEREVFDLQNKLDIITNFLEKYGSLEALREVISKKQEREEVGYWMDDEPTEYGYFDDMIRGKNKAKKQAIPTQEKPVAQPVKDKKAKESKDETKQEKSKPEQTANSDTIKKGVPYKYEIEGEDEGEKPKASKGKDVANISEGQRGSDGGKGTKPEGQKDSNNGKGPGEPTTPESGRIELIKFEIYKTLPSYLIITADGKEERFYPIDKKDKKYIEEDVYKRLRGKDKKLLQEKFGNMQDIEKVFDRGLENVLMQFDIKHGLVKDGEANQTARFYQMFNDMSDSGKMKDPLNISYNLSELHSADMNISDKRALKRMVRSLDKHNMAWYIAKPKNFFARLFGGVKLLGDGKENAKNIEETAREETVTEQIKKMTPQEVAEIYKNVSKESSFNERIFWEQMGLSDEEIKAVKDELAKENPCKKFREDMRKTAEKSEERHDVVLTEDMKKAIKIDYTDLYDTPGFSDTEFARKYGLTNEQLADIRDIVIAEETARFVAKSQVEDKKQKAEAAAKTEKGTTPETPEEMADRILRENPEAGQEWRDMRLKEINDELRERGLYDAAEVGHEPDDER